MVLRAVEVLIGWPSRNSSCQETLYLGERAVELRLHIDAGARAQIEAMPIIGGSFTKTKLTSRAERARKVAGNTTCMFFAPPSLPVRRQGYFRPSEITFNAQVRPQQRRRDRTRSLLEEMLGNDPFRFVRSVFFPNAGCNG